MIVRFAKPGKSFRGLAVYLTHDPEKARTAERVAWTHTINLANDHIPSAVDEMLWSCRAADQLKRQAGIAAGGRRLEYPVKHFSLNWAPSDEPGREEMIEAVRDFMKHLGWQDHQAALIAHNDKHYRHVHVMVNAVSPIDGRGLDTSFEKARASAWALDYEREHFRIHCEQRLKPYAEREPSPSRETWQKLKEAERQHDRAEYDRVVGTPDYFEREHRDVRDAKEWELLKSHQHDQRIAFFAEGKKAYREVRNAIFREVRTEFHGEWSVYFDAKRRGMDAESLHEMKADIVARQNAELESRRESACRELRERRDAEYQQLLCQEKEEKAELAQRQEQGLDSPHLLGLVYPPEERSEPGGTGEFSRERADAYFRSAARETCSPGSEREPETEAISAPENFERAANENFKVHDGVNLMGGLGLGALGAIAEVGERLFDGFFGGKPAPKCPDKAQRQPSETHEPKDKRMRAVEAQIKASDTQRAEAEQLRAYWQERRQRRHYRD